MGKVPKETSKGIIEHVIYQKKVPHDGIFARNFSLFLTVFFRYHIIISILCLRILEEKNVFFCNFACSYKQKFLRTESWVNGFSLGVFSNVVGNCDMEHLIAPQEHFS